MIQYSLRGITADELSFKVNLINLAPDAKIEIKPMFRRQIRPANDDKRTFAINATETMFPYLRAAVTNLTADALINPLTLPVVSGATIFPDDRGPDKYTLSFDPKVIN